MQDPLDHQPDWFDDADKQGPYSVEVPTENQFILLCVLTLGLYAIWWMYKCWRYFEEQERRRLYSALRAVFSIIFLYGLFLRIRQLSATNKVPAPYSSLALYLGYISISLAGYLPEPYFLLAMFAYLLLLPPYRTFYAALEASKQYNILWQISFNQRQQLLVFLGGLMWLLLVAGLFGV